MAHEDKDHGSPRGSRLSIESLLEHLTERDLALVHDLDALRLATTRHLQRLHFALVSHHTFGAATRACVRVLSRLKGLGVVANLPRRIGGVRAGSAGYIWQIGPSGERLLRALRGEPNRRRAGSPSGLFIAHTLAIADLIVSLRERAVLQPELRVDTITEPNCWQPYVGPHGQRETLRPDLLVVTTSTEYEDHTFVEVDLGTESLPVVLRKCHAYERYAATGAYQRLHGVFPAVLWSTSSTERAAAIREAIHADGRLDDSAFDAVTHADALERLLQLAETDDDTDLSLDEAITNE